MKPPTFRHEGNFLVSRESESGEYGPMCSCCGKRGLKRIAPHEYRCPRTHLEMRFYVRDGGYFPVPLKTAKAMDALGVSTL